MAYNAGLLQIKKQTAMNVYFIKNFKKREKKNLKFRQFTVSGYRAERFCSLSYLMKIRLEVLLSVPVLQEEFPKILL